MAVTDDYKVRLEIFEGPLDLLLYLIRKEEVDIYDIPIERITTQYMEYLGLMRMLDLNIAGEFIVMAATLMAVKSRMLLPPEDRPEEDVEEEDPRWELVRQLVEYKKFKDAATHLQALEAHQQSIFPSSGTELPPEEEDAAGVLMHEVSIFDLLSAFNRTLRRVRQEDLAEIFAEKFTVADKIEAVLSVLRERGALVFDALFAPTASRYEVVCTFLALLELIRLHQVRATQNDAFGDIEIALADVSGPN